MGEITEPSFLLSSSETDGNTLGQMPHLLTVLLQNGGFVRNFLLFWTCVKSTVYSRI
jgi:hypothetical protein